MRRISLMGALAMWLLIGAAGCDDDSTAPEIPDDQPNWETVENVIGSDEYLDNRFFLFDLSDPFIDESIGDEPGRPFSYTIDPGSVRIYESVPGAEVEPPLSISVYPDTTGVFWSTPDSPTWNFSNPYLEAENWQPVEVFRFLYSSDGRPLAIDFGREVAPETVLAVSFRATGPADEELRIGDDPMQGDPPYRMKLLKAPAADREPHSFRYVLRNIYDMGFQRIDPENFSLELERGDPAAAHPELDENGIPYVTIFGLDQWGSDDGGPDGEADYFDSFLFDLSDGLLFFPLHNMSPFAASREQYELDADNEDFTWEGTFLADHLAPELYDPSILPGERSGYRHFSFRCTSRRIIPDALESISLSRLDWHRASLPLAEVPGDGERLREQRVEAIRWFLPREKVTAHDLDPDLLGTAAAVVVPVLQLFLWNEEGTWAAGQWGGVMQGLSRAGLDISDADALEFWVNDAEPDTTLRSGTLHFDFGWISEDFFWPVDGGDLVVGTWEREDGILPGMDADGVWTQEEDIGLAGDEWGPERYDASYETSGSVDYPGPSAPYPGLNGTARNNRNDTEDINDNGRLDTENSYLSAAVALRDSAAYDVLRDCTDPFDADRFYHEDKAWRRYRIPLAEFEMFADDGEWNAERITHCRIWYENPGPQHSAVQLQLTGIRFVTDSQR